MERPYRDAGAAVHELPRAAARDNARAVADLAKRIEADLIHTNNTGLDRRAGLWGSKLAGLPHVNTLHSMGDSCDPAGEGLSRLKHSLRLASKRLRWRLEGRIASHVTRRVIAVSRHVKDTWRPWLDVQGVDAGRVTIVHPGLDLAEFDAAARAPRDATRASLRAAPDDLLIICVGRLVHGKGQQELPAMMAELSSAAPRARLLLAGDGPMRPELESAFARAGVAESVTFLGDRTDIPALLAASDVMVFPSYAEGFGLAPLEAMAAALPVVSFALPSLREFMEDGKSGLFADPGRGLSLAACIGRILSDRDVARRMGAHGRRIVEDRFTMQRVASEMSHTYQSAVFSGRRT